jgi:hypothetical protein
MPGLEQLPKEGCMLVEFRRKRLSIEEGADGEETAGVTLELRSICLPEDGGAMDGEDDGEGSSDMETAMRNAMKKSTSENEDEDDDEE